MAALVVVVSLLPTSPASSTSLSTTTTTTTPSSDATIQHYEYVFPDGSMVVYDMDHGHRIVETVPLPTRAGVRGVAASPPTHTLFVSYGGDGGPHGPGSLLAYDLLAKRVLWKKRFGHGIDSFDVSRDGRRIYMPDGELSDDGYWYVLDASSGRQLGRITGGTGPHNTAVGPSGTFVYLGGREHDYLEVASVKTNKVVKRVGPLQDTLRPFTVNGRETLAFTTATGKLGFQVGDLRTGKVLYTETFKGFQWDPAKFPGISAPSHGVSLSPDERELYVIDAPNSFVHVFDVSGLPKRRPRQVADIKITSMKGGENPCAYDCDRDGWLQHSRDGRFVYVGDAGDVIDTATRRPVAHLSALRNSRKMLEIDWQNDVPIATTGRQGLGYVTPLP